ncbi:class I tRNA ligase family protein [Solwaraspora sp. WMMD1047]|uniref:class I tRNA ligase family protein n=1 Tax=Solwaraspora sp. WMMD1047 TaxID=3016102 RepID=UPI0024176806|nr:class I tRNA ligase family protein [Solwaraspora sp. WMMD1047]MDG4829600.1 class I tRNA ligase family protein [Solwaraspora sp. WMMD1047]
MTNAGPVGDRRRRDPSAAEARWAREWQTAGLFTADPHSERPRFAMVLPPPSLNAVLHLGHALQISVQDVLARYRRMAGYEVLWLPGTDHAAISTQRAIEQDLQRQGRSREQIGRAAFRVVSEQWFDSMAGRILDQAVAIGASVDLTRQRFTMDAAYQAAVRRAFVQLWEKGFIFRAPRVINYCPSCRAVLSDMEVAPGPARATGFRLRLEVAGDRPPVPTTAILRRPEHLLAVTAVGVGPDHPAFAELVGGQVELPVSGRTVPVVAYPPAGAEPVLLVPAHDADHLDFARDGRIEVRTVVRPDRLVHCPDLPAFHGRPVTVVAEELAKRLTDAGAIGDHPVPARAAGECDRCGETVDQFAIDQWFVRMAELCKPALAAAADGLPRWRTDGHEQRYLDWLTEQRDWCISRQLWLGHRIPVYTCDQDHVFATVAEPERCPRCGSDRLGQDPDVLDTWFSSALWPFATLGWPDETPELRAFFPLDAWIFSREVIGLALVRTVAVSLELTGRVPFRNIVISGLVQSVDGVKMSTAKGNSVAPEYVIGRYGADALRAWAAEVALTGQDVRFDEARIRRFHRLVKTLTERCAAVFERRCPERRELSLVDRWMLIRLDEVTRTVTGAMEAYDFRLAIRQLDEFVSNDLNGFYLLPSASGTVPAASARIARDVVGRLLRLLHPFLPFATEELWERLGDEPGLLAGASWPVPSGAGPDPEAGRQVAAVRSVLKELRRLRTDFGVAPGDGGDLHLGGFLTGEPAELLAELAGVRLVPEPAPGAVALAGSPVSVRFDAAGVAADTRRSERHRLRKQRHRLRARMADEAFLAKAPAEVVSRLRKELAEIEAALDRIDENPTGGH